MANQPLEVHIKKGVDTAEGTKSPTTQESMPKRIDEVSVTSRATQAHLIKVGRDAINLGVNKVGDLTGNYSFANKVNNIVSIGGAISTLVVAGPGVGGIVIGGKALISGITAGIDNYVEVRSINFNNARLGRISLGKSGD